jgi:branched-chain amino acid transport system substrate-binding protein
MPNQPGDVRVSRRTFLRRFGAMAGALAAGQLVSACSNSSAAGLTPNLDQAAKPMTVHGSTARQDTLRVGLLLPKSQLYPTIGANFRAGMDLYLAQSSSNTTNRPIALLAHDYGTTPSTALEHANALIGNGQVDMIVGSLSSGTAAALHPLLHEHQMPLLISNIGANLTRDDRQSPYIIRNSFSYWQSSWALGRWAAGNMGKQAFVASSFYDSGYDSLYAFQLGFESGGGTVQSTKVTHLPTDTGELHTLMAEIQQAQPDLVFAAYSGSQASDFVRSYAHAGLAARIPLLGSGFLVDESLLSQQGDAALGIKTALPWARTLDLSANQSFTSAFQNFSGRPADPFAVLGYDTARLIAQCACTASGPNQMRQALATAAFDSPRGAVRMDETLLEINTPLYLREVRALDGGLSNIVIDKLPALPTNNAEIAALRATERTGWSNAYLYI